jgi:hypothetical protein
LELSTHPLILKASIFKLLLQTIGLIRVSASFTAGSAVLLIVHFSLPVFIFLVASDEEPIHLVEFRQISHHPLPLFQARSHCLDGFFQFGYSCILSLIVLGAACTTGDLHPLDIRSTGLAGFQSDIGLLQLPQC